MAEMQPSKTSSGKKCIKYMQGIVLWSSIALVYEAQFVATSAAGDDTLIGVTTRA